MTLPTMEQLEARFDELHHVEEQILIEKQWFWYGIAAYTKLLSELAHEDWLKCKAEIQQELTALLKCKAVSPA